MTAGENGNLQLGIVGIQLWDNGNLQLWDNRNSLTLFPLFWCCRPGITDAIPGVVGPESIPAFPDRHHRPHSPLCHPAGRGMAGRGRGGFGGRGRGRGRGRGSARPALTKEQLDNQLDAYMSKTKGHLDAELDAYMAQTDPEAAD